MTGTGCLVMERGSLRSRWSQKRACFGLLIRRTLIHQYKHGLLTNLSACSTCSMVDCLELTKGDAKPLALFGLLVVVEQQRSQVCVGAEWETRSTRRVDTNMQTTTNQANPNVRLGM